MLLCIAFLYEGFVYVVLKGEKFSINVCICFHHYARTNPHKEIQFFHVVVAIAIQSFTKSNLFATIGMILMNGSEQICFH